MTGILQREDGKHTLRQAMASAAFVVDAMMAAGAARDKLMLRAAASAGEGQRPAHAHYAA